VFQYGVILALYKYIMYTNSRDEYETRYY